jgi:alanine racemase
VWSERVVNMLIQTWKPWKVHFFLNTWMHREGIQLEKLWSLLQKVQDSPLQVVGVMSHFANADEIDASFDDVQIQVFEAWVQMVQDAWYIPQYLHHNNTAWLTRHQDSIFTASRTGLGMLWYSPFTKNDEAWKIYEELQPTLSVFSTVTAIQDLKAWDSVSYWQCWVASEDTRVAIIPFGYNEWLRRSLKDTRQVRWNDHYFPVVGTICMNLCCIDIGDAKVEIWDRIEVISNKKNSLNSVSCFAAVTETIVYEVLVNLDGFGKRVVV